MPESACFQIVVGQLSALKSSSGKGNEEEA
jgi:hypothetical protein